MHVFLECSNLCITRLFLYDFSNGCINDVFTETQAALYTLKCEFIENLYFIGLQRLYRDKTIVSRGVVA